MLTCEATARDAQARLGCEDIEAKHKRCGCELLRKEGLAGGLILGLLLAFSASPALAADLELGS